EGGTLLSLFRAVDGHCEAAARGPAVLEARGTINAFFAPAGVAPHHPAPELRDFGGNLLVDAVWYGITHHRLLPWVGWGEASSGRIHCFCSRSRTQYLRPHPLGLSRCTDRTGRQAKSKKRHLHATQTPSQ